MLGNTLVTHITEKPKFLANESKGFNLFWYACRTSSGSSKASSSNDNPSMYCRAMRRQCVLLARFCWILKALMCDSTNKSTCCAVGKPRPLELLASGEAGIKFHISSWQINDHGMK